MTRRRFNISLVNNNILELSEIFNITVDSNLLPDKVSFSNQPSQVFINDDDCEYSIRLLSVEPQLLYLGLLCNQTQLFALLE